MKRLILSLGIVLATVTANAAYLLWQVATDYSEAIGTYDYVRLIYKDTDGSRVALSTQTKEGAAGGAIKTDLPTLSDDVSYSIFVELVNYSNGEWNQVGITSDATALTYSSTAACSSEIDLGDAATIPAVWTGGTINVPEPTSGMMVMMGLAFLALKRRKA